MKPLFATECVYPDSKDPYGQASLSRAAANVSWPTSKMYEAVVEQLLVEEQGRPRF